MKKADTGPITLKVWVLSDEEVILRPVTDSYTQKNPRIKFEYIKNTPLNYRTRLETQIGSGSGPDIMRIHYSWIPMLKNNLTPAPSNVITSSQFRQAYFPIFQDSLIIDNQVMAMPTELDGIVMYYNENILKAANVLPPKTWEEFLSAARKMTVRNSSGQIQTSGAAMGATNNIEYWPEIVGTLFYQQPNARLDNPANKDGAEVLQFYTSFITDPRTKTWDQSLPSAAQMFTEERLAFYFGPSTKARDFKASNPNLNFKVAPMPQIAGKNIAWGSFWVYGVSARSAHPEESWLFLNFLSSSTGLRTVYQAQYQQTGMGKAFPRLDTAQLFATDPYLSTFINQAPSMKGWYLNSFTRDVGLNDEMITVYKGAIDGVLQGLDAQSTLQTATPAIQEILRKYNVPTN